MGYGTIGRDGLHPWPEESQRYYSQRDNLTGSSNWDPTYYPTSNNADPIHSVVINDANGGRVVPSTLYYNSLPSGRNGRSGRGGRTWSKQRSPVEVVTIKSQHNQLPETSI